MRLALMFGQRQERRVPGIAVQTRGLVDRQAEVVADVGTRNPLELIFVKERRPFARQVHRSAGATLGDERDITSRGAGDDNTCKGKPQNRFHDEQPPRKCYIRSRRRETSTSGSRRRRRPIARAKHLPRFWHSPTRSLPRRRRRPAASGPWRNTECR